jgi:hypothetical protein
LGVLLDNGVSKATLIMHQQHTDPPTHTKTHTNANTDIHAHTRTKNNLIVARDESKRAPHLHVQAKNAHRSRTK